MARDRATGTIIRINDTEFDAARVDAAILEMETALGVPTAAIAQRALARMGALRELTDERPLVEPGKPRYDSEKWGYVLPRFRARDARGRSHLSPIELAQLATTGHHEYRTYRFELTRLVPGFVERAKFIPGFVKRWLGRRALFMEIGPNNYRETDLAKREKRMLHREGKTADATREHRQRMEATDRNLRRKEDMVGNRRQVRAANTLEHRDAAKTALDMAEDAYIAAVAAHNRNASDANTSALIAARQARESARIAYNRADYNSRLAVARAYFAREVLLARYWIKRDRKTERTVTKHHTSVPARPTVIVGIRLA